MDQSINYEEEFGSIARPRKIVHVDRGAMQSEKKENEMIGEKGNDENSNTMASVLQRKVTGKDLQEIFMEKLPTLSNQDLVDLHGFMTEKLMKGGILNLQDLKRCKYLIYRQDLNVAEE